MGRRNSPPGALASPRLPRLSRRRLMRRSWARRFDRRWVHRLPLPRCRVHFHASPLHQSIVEVAKVAVLQYSVLRPLPLVPDLPHFTRSTSHCYLADRSTNLRIDPTPPLIVPSPNQPPAPVHSYPLGATWLGSSLTTSWSNISSRSCWSYNCVSTPRVHFCYLRPNHLSFASCGSGSLCLQKIVTSISHPSQNPIRCLWSARPNSWRRATNPTLWNAPWWDRGPNFPYSNFPGGLALIQRVGLHIFQL